MAEQAVRAEIESRSRALLAQVPRPSSNSAQPRRSWRRSRHEHLLNQWFRARRAWRENCGSEALAIFMTKKASG